MSLQQECCSYRPPHVLPPGLRRYYSKCAKNGGVNGAGSGAMGVEALLGEDRPAVLKSVDLDDLAAVVTNSTGEILMVNQVGHHHDLGGIYRSPGSGAHFWRHWVLKGGPQG